MSPNELCDQKMALDTAKITRAVTSSVSFFSLQKTKTLFVRDKPVS